ncbi:MAG TPA: CHAT domain-containing protein [Gemmatimonadales bacterium]
MIRAAAVFLLAWATLGCRRAGDDSVKSGLAPPPPTVTMQRADSLYAAGEYQAAIGIWQKTLAEARQDGDSVRAAMVLTSIGLADRNLGDYLGSRESGEAALALKLRLGLRHELFRSFNALGLLAWDEGRLDDAAALFRQASEAAGTVGDSLGVAKAANNMALVQRDRGELAEARSGLMRAREVSQSLGDSVLLGRVLDNLAMIDLQLGDPVTALSSAEAARRLAQASGDAKAEENALGQLATAYHALGEPQRALAAIDSAMALAEAHGLRRQVAEDLKLLGDYHAAAGDHRRALDHYRRAQVLNRELGLPEDEGNTLRSEAWSFHQLGLADTALVRARRALAIHRTGGFPLAELEDELLLAGLATSRKDRQAAARALAEADRTARRIGSPLAMTQVALGVARVEDQVGQPDRVLAALERAGTGLALLSGADSWEPDALRARAYARLGQPDAAEAAGRRAVSAIERVRGNYGSGTLRTSFLSERVDVYAHLMLVLLARGRTEEAFEVADAARGRALLEHLGTARREVEQGGGSGGELFRGEQLLRRIDELTRQLRSVAGEPPGERGAAMVATTRSLEDRLAEARTDYEALIARIARQGPGAATLLGAGGLAAVDVRRSLRSGERLVEYLVTPDSLHLFLVSRDGVTHAGQPITAQALGSRVRLARELTAEPDSLTARDAVLKGLYQLLVAPVERSGGLAGVERLIVVPHGTLAYLPFAALMDERGDPLVTRFSVLVLPAASALPALRQRPARAGRLGSVALAPLPRELPATRGEVEDVRRVLGSKVVLGGAATEAALRRALGSASVVHVATHGVMNPANPMFTRLELARGRQPGPEDDGRLEVHELLGFRVTADLVYLSGCETARGSAWLTEFERGEDYVTLGQAFLYAGAGNVVATLWRVDDPGAAAFARKFYEALKKSDPVEALATAQRGMLREPEHRAPYYWAAYQVSGAGAPREPAVEAPFQEGT